MIPNIHYDADEGKDRYVPKFGEMPTYKCTKCGCTSYSKSNICPVCPNCNTRMTPTEKGE